MNLESELFAAIAAVRQAAKVTQAVQRNLVTAQTLTKKDRSPVTVADFASQAVVCRSLVQALSQAAVVGEEDAAALREADHAAVRARVVEQVRQVVPDANETAVLHWIDLGGAAADPTKRYWTLDPIDGTKGFLRGEQYAIALALIDRGEVVLGVLACPNLPRNPLPRKVDQPQAKGLLMAAVRGQGTVLLPLDGEGLNDVERVRADGDVALSQARFCESVESGHSDQDQSARIAAQLGITREPVRMDSQAKYATVARGEASIYLRLPTSTDYRENIWDHAAGKLVVEEAGGTVTDIDGRPLDFAQGKKLRANRGIVATQSVEHGKVIAAVVREEGEALRGVRGS